MWLPGLVTLLSVHVGVLVATVERAKELGVSWSLLKASTGTLAGFWIAFFLPVMWVGTRTAVNLLGLAAVVLGWGGPIVWVVWWLVGFIWTELSAL